MGSSQTSSSRKKSKQSRKVKKELRRLKRKNDKKQRFGLFSSKIAWTLAFCFNGALGAAVPEDGYPLAEAAKDGSLFARIFNSYALAQDIKEGKLDVLAMAKELLDMDADQTIEALQIENYQSIQNQIEGAINVMDTKCQNGNCVDVQKIERGLTTAEDASKFSSEKIKPTLSSLENLKVVRTLYSSIVELIKAATTYKELIEQIPNVKKKDMNQFVGSMWNVVPKMVNAEETYNNATGYLKKVSSANINYEEQFKLIISFDKEILSLKQKTEFIDVMKQELKELQKLVKEMRRFLSKDDIEPVMETINLLLQFVRNPKIPIDKKTLTPGFPRGLEDLNKVPDDLKAPLKDILADGKSSDKLNDFLKNAIDTSKQFVSLVTIADARTVIYAIDQRIENVQRELQAAYADISRTDVFDKLLECFGGSFGIRINSGDWKVEKETFIENKQDIENFIISVTTSKVSPFGGFNEIKTFCNSLDMKVSDSNKAYQDIITYPNLSTVTSEVDQLENSLSSGNYGKLDIWMSQSQFGSILNNTRKLVNEVDFEPLIKCFNKDNILEASKKVMKEGQFLSSLFQINSKNENFKAFFDALSAMKKPNLDWENFKKQRKVREASDSVTPVILEKPFDVAKKFGKGVKALLDFAVADEALSAMKTILNKQSVIDSEITNLKDDEQKTKISKVWNENTKKILKEIVDFVDKMKKSTGKKPTRLADFKEVFEAYGSDALPNFNGRELSHLLSFIQNDQNVEASLKSLGSLNLEFSSSKKKLSDAGSTLDPLEKFFDGFFGIVRAPSVAQNGTGNDKKVDSNDNEGLSKAAIIIIAIVCFLLLLAAFVAGYFIIKKIREIRKKKKAEDEKKRKKREEEAAKARALLQKRKEDAKKDKENAHIKTQPQIKGNGPKEEDKNGNKKKEKPHNPTIAIEDMTEEQFTTKLTRKKPKKIQEKMKEKKVDVPAAVEEFRTKKEQYLKNFYKVHRFTTQQLARATVVDESIYDLKFDSKKEDLEKKYNNAMELAETQQDIDNEAFDQNGEKKEYQIPDKLSREDVKMLMNMRPAKGKWTATTIHYNGVKREYKVSNATDVITRLNELINRKDGDDTTPSLATTQSCTSLSRTPSNLNTACSIKDPSHRAATAGDSREDVETDEELSSTSANSSTSVDLEGQQKPQEKPGIFQRLCNRYIAGADEDPFDFGFSKRGFRNDEEYLITQLIAALSKKFRVIDSCYDFKDKVAFVVKISFHEHTLQHPITENMFTSLLEKAKLKFSAESAILQLDAKNMRVVGDIHGKYADFVRQVFDSRRDSCLFPEKFMFLRGNHETRHINTNYELKEECECVFKKRGPDVQEKMNKLFDTFPLGAEFHQKVFLAHGGISEHMLEGREVLNEITKTPKTVRQWNLYYDILWCDLVYFYKSKNNKTAAVFTRSKRCAYATVCNQNALRKVMDAMGWLFVIRGHEVKTAGYEYFSERRAITIFGSTQNSNNNMAVQLILSDAGHLTMYRHDCTDEDPDDDDAPTIG
ncbi:hypothetical protein CAEBREN_08864 [Caenorhabditis brenneri]|uniref:Serine/threonine-protein phosphatase n=1 Tax=Caenorhabditis brenneri TaxID=135651 RepID=G0PAA4_CAEBE|nr:hypothetical protein CAEBREN_08864 [Caenorhabditis brenneri]